jgi:hypothetical protein
MHHTVSDSDLSFNQINSSPNAEPVIESGGKSGWGKGGVCVFVCVSQQVGSL